MIELNRLLELNEKYPTDKGQHGYWGTYSKYLPDTCRSFLEVGVANGHSAMIWSDLYGADTLDLHLLDLYINPDFVSPRWARNRGFVPRVGNQVDIPFLYTIKEAFSIISEDGSHNSADQQITFKHLFWNNLQRGGVYFLEDTHCCTMEGYWNDGIDRFEDTALSVFKGFLETGELRNKYFNEQESADFTRFIGTVEICADDKLIVITKR